MYLDKLIRRKSGKLKLKLNLKLKFMNHDQL